MCPREAVNVVVSGFQLPSTAIFSADRRYVLGVNDGDGFGNIVPLQSFGKLQPVTGELRRFATDFIIDISPRRPAPLGAIDKLSCNFMVTVDLQPGYLMALPLPGVSITKLGRKALQPVELVDSGYFKATWEEAKATLWVQLLKQAKAGVGLSFAVPKAAGLRLPGELPAIGSGVSLEIFSCNPTEGPGGCPTVPRADTVKWPVVPRDDLMNPKVVGAKNSRVEKGVGQGENTALDLFTPYKTHAVFLLSHWS